MVREVGLVRLLRVLSFRSTSVLSRISERLIASISSIALYDCITYGELLRIWRF